MGTIPFSAFQFHGFSSSREFQLTIARAEPRSQLFRISIVAKRAEGSPQSAFMCGSTVTLSDHADTSLARILERMQLLFPTALDVENDSALKDALNEWLSGIL